MFEDADAGVKPAGPATALAAQRVLDRAARRRASSPSRSGMGFLGTGTPRARGKWRWSPGGSQLEEDALDLHNCEPFRRLADIEMGASARPCSRLGRWTRARHRGVRADAARCVHQLSVVAMSDIGSRPSHAPNDGEARGRRPPAALQFPRTCVSKRACRAQGIAFIDPFSRIYNALSLAAFTSSPLRSPCQTRRLRGAAARASHDADGDLTF